MGSLPKYEELARRITGDIQNGIYPDGTPLPSEAELAAQAGVSRVTVRQALVQLSRLGIIVKQQGRRSVVNVAAVPERTRFRRGHSRLSGNFQYSATYDDENQRQSGFHADD